ncbi:MAG: glycogen synthase GlgA [FCB group bacterium]|nr:glycogen synthase GlgA [FCB group bacterium]
MENLKILYVASEVIPYAKTGGLADVAGVLPRVLAEMGHELKVVMPRYGSIPPILLEQAKVAFAVDIKRMDQPDTLDRLRLYRIKDETLPLEYLFIDNEKYFNRPELYRNPKTGKDYIDNDDRFIFFCRGLLESLKKLLWIPDIIHANDWQAALLPIFLATAYRKDPFYARTKSVFTIHNMAYHGMFPEESFDKLGLPANLYYPTGPFEFWGKLNFMKAAIYYADLITTVSENYAVEIQSSDEYGCGLDGVLKSRTEDIFGILNGVDYNEWSPATDRYIPFNFSSANIARKRDNKVELMIHLGLPLRDKTPLIGMITRLADQKGLDLVADIADDLFDLDIQMVVLGTGDLKYHKLLEKLEKKYPDKLKVMLAYDNKMAHWIEAAADMFLMPSRYEPCGLNQMYSLKYGTVPIVRSTGGLADTIDDVDEKSGDGTGFVFDKYDPEELLSAIKRAVDLFAGRKNWRRVMKEGMARDYSWQQSAHKYAELYLRALNKN